MGISKKTTLLLTRKLEEHDSFPGPTQFMNRVSMKSRLKKRQEEAMKAPAQQGRLVNNLFLHSEFGAQWIVVFAVIPTSIVFEGGEVD